MITPVDLVLSSIPDLDVRYTAKESRKKTVAILGSSVSKDSLKEALQASSDVTRYFIENGYNVVHGCGSRGIMGKAYNTAAEYSAKDASGKPVQNLAIIVEPLWGDENLSNCVPIGKAASEAERIAKFGQVADNFVIFPGGPTTLQETTTLIQKNRYLPKFEAKKLVLFGSDFWEGVVIQYKKLFEMNLLKENPLGKLFHVVNSKEEVFKLIFRK